MKLSPGPSRFSSFLIFFAGLFVVASITLGCGSGRQLQSISISQTTNGEQVQLVATGTYSSAPMTVTPIAVEWGLGPAAPPPPTYTLTTQPFTWDCSQGSPGIGIYANAPPDAGAPSTGRWRNRMVGAVATITCP